MLDFSARTDIDNSNLIAYPNGAIKDNTGSGDGTAVNRAVYNDIYQLFLKVKRLAGIDPSGLPDNETNGFQYLEAFVALASKNDYRHSLTLDTGVLRLPVKLSFMQDGEFLICRAAFAQGSETQIRGTDNTLFSFSGGNSFKTGDNVLVIKSGSTFILTRLVDRANFDAIAIELSYLKAASQAEENAGTIDTKGTTPLSNKTVYERRTIGVDSGGYLAKPTGDPDQRNGLLSSADKLKIDNFDSGIVNRGTVSGIEPGGGGAGSLPRTGDISAAAITDSGSGAMKFRITFANAMPSSDYRLQIYVESLGANMIVDSRVGVPVFQPVSTTQCDICISEFGTGIQSLRFHIDAVKL